MTIQDRFSSEPGRNNALGQADKPIEGREVVPAGVSDAVELVKDAQAKRVHALLQARLGDEVYASWFAALEIHKRDGAKIETSVPVKFLQSWIQSHYSDDLLECCQNVFPMVEHVEVRLRQPGDQSSAVEQPAAQTPAVAPSAPLPSAALGVAQPSGRTQAAGFVGSPIDPRLTLESFVVGPANRMAHAAATQVAETVFSETRQYNPLFLTASVGNGKTHLLHAIAWEVRKRHPHAQLLYLTAERFRFEFVEALQSKGAMAFKEKFRGVDILLIDDLEYLSGPATEQEFEHLVNALLDSNRQLVVASSKPPNAIDRLNDRMRSRLQGGLVVELGAPDFELRRGILKRRIESKQMVDPSFQVAPEIIDMLAERLTDGGRELDGAVIRLHMHWDCMRVPITTEITETIIRNMIHGIEQKRTRIEDILKVVSRHFGVSRSDILSQRRHRSVVWPRQIGMFLSKQLTARSLPEIGRRFGNRDHTTVLHAIRKIDGEISKNPRLKDEIEDLKKLLGH
ncbi:MAG: chromosomal replication initiator protein DnaA [Pseudomonadota bacterium]